MKIPHITKTHEDRFVKGLSYAVRYRRGTANHLRAKCGAEVMDEFVNNGIVKTSEKGNGTTKFKITEKGNNLFKQKFGQFEYYKSKILGVIEQLTGNTL